MDELEKLKVALEKARRESHADLMQIKESVLSLEAERDRYKAALTEIRSFVCVPVEASPDPEVDDMASVLNAGSVISMVLIARRALAGDDSKRDRNG